jgi:hypothetical protein
MKNPTEYDGVRQQSEGALLERALNVFRNGLFGSFLGFRFAEGFSHV